MSIIRRFPCSPIVLETTRSLISPYISLQHTPHLTPDSHLRLIPPPSLSSPACAAPVHRKARRGALRLYHPRSSTRQQPYPWPKAAHVPSQIHRSPPREPICPDATALLSPLPLSKKTRCGYPTPASSLSSLLSSTTYPPVIRPAARTRTPNLQPQGGVPPRIGLVVRRSRALLPYITRSCCAEVRNRNMIPPHNYRWHDTSFLRTYKNKTCSNSIAFPAHRRSL